MRLEQQIESEYRAAQQQQCYNERMLQVGRASFCGGCGDVVAGVWVWVSWWGEVAQQAAGRLPLWWRRTRVSIAGSTWHFP